MENEKVTIIGSGPAGLAAAIYTARAGLNPLVIGGSPYGGQLMLTTEVENFPGFPTIMGPELIETMRKQVKGLNVRIIDQNITSIDFSKKPFTLGYLDKTITTDAVIIATGAKALWLGLESETRLRGKGVSACATCDGFFFKGKDVAVVGGGDTAMEEALTLTKFASKVYLIHRRSEFRASKIMGERVKSHKNIEVILDTQITEVVGENKVEGIKAQNIKTHESRDIKLDGVFVAIGHKPDTELFKNAIKLDEAGYILTNAMLAERIMLGKEPSGAFKPTKDHCYYGTATSVEGVFAAGDCVDHVYRQAATAAGLGVSAALDAERWLEA
ncbi:thioredoxin-disulfide reductase [Candidatus Microgenomates bacterium]|nr:thioredoxin-disulfide reductase [Candidatus Microgenomates bacterium]